jgi:hypothetical protein
MDDWKIQRRTSACRRCERPFEEGARHASVLAVVGEELVREDICEACWNAREPAGGGELFWWFPRHAAERKKTVSLDLEMLERLFLALESRPEFAVRELRYLICLLLLRKRRLKVERIERGGEGESFVVKRPRREERHRVFVFDFDAARMAELRVRLQAVFDGAELDEGTRLVREQADSQDAELGPEAPAEPAGAEPVSEPGAS